ncbi:hypothetical protein NKH18_00695 [Streptomyces sp. M10(2022)]
MTAGLREAMDDVRRSGAVLAAGSAPRTPPRSGSPGLHLVGVVLRDGVRHQPRPGVPAARRRPRPGRDPRRRHRRPGTSRTRDSDPGAAAALDYGLSQRALIDVSGRTGDVAELITRRLATLAHSGLQALDEPPCAPWSARPSATSAPHRPAARRSASGSRTHRAAPRRRRPRRHHPPARGLMLEVAPAYLSDTAAADVLAPLCEQIGETLENGLAARRYAMSGDRRALYGTVL